MKSKTIIIGASPLAITEAVFLQETNVEVSVLEAKESIGGAWTTICYDNLPEIEIGCHIWSYEKSVYDFLAKFFKIDLIELTPSPRIIKGKRFIPYDWKSNVISGGKFMKTFFTGKWSQLKSVRASPDFRFSLMPATYLYPKNGAKDLGRALLSVVENHKVDIKLESLVRSLVITNNEVQCHLSNGDVELCNELVLTSLSDIETISFEDGSEMLLTKRKVDYISMHLLVDHKGDSGKSFSYLRVMDDKVVHRVSDMTSQVKSELEVNHQLICLGIWEESFNKMTKEGVKDHCRVYLRSLGLLKEGAEVVRFNYNVYSSLYSNGAEISEISKRSNGKIRILRSTDFVYSFFNQLDRYKVLLDGNS